MAGQVLKFIGMNNVIDPTDLDWQQGQCTDMVNIDPDNGGGIAVRDRFTGALPSVDSVFVNDILFSASVQTLTLGNFGAVPESYQPGAFDVSVSGGDCIEEYRGRVYRAGLLTGAAVVIGSKPLEYSTVNLREMVAYLSSDEITMIGAVDNGLYVGTRSGLFFLSGTSQLDFTRNRVLDYGVIKNTRARTIGHKVPVAQMSGKVIVFTTYRGVCVAGDGGNVVNLSYGKVSFPFGTEGRTMLREANGLVHYIFQPINTTSEAINALNLPTIEVDSKTTT
jgi:hypothetical protein